MASAHYMPWSTTDSDFLGAVPELALLTCKPVSVQLSIQGRNGGLRTESVPAQTSVTDLKGHLRVNGVVSTCEGLQVMLQEGGEVLGDDVQLELQHGQTLYLRNAAEMVSITAIVSTEDGLSDGEVYELVVPAVVTGAQLRDHINNTTVGALVAAAVFVPSDDGPAHVIGDDEVFHLKDDMAICVERAAPAPEAAAPPPSSQPKGGVVSSLFSRFRGSKEEEASGFRLRCASNVKVSGSKVACVTNDPWAACAVFDVEDPAFFEIGVQLLSDAPNDTVDGLGGRWLLGVVPTVFAATKTDAQRKSLLNGGYFVTVCHGHPAKVRAPSMPRGTCGEDMAAVPGELRAGQVLTLRWTGSGVADVPGVLTVQVDDTDIVSVPYSVPPFEDLRPCLIFGGKPAEVRILQLKSKRAGGA